MFLQLHALLLLGVEMQEGSNVTADSTDSESSSKNNITKDSPDHHHHQQQGLVGLVTVASQFHQITEQYQPQHQQRVRTTV